MKKILIFAGTTEGRRLSESLADAGVAHTLCVATEYGELVLKNHPLVQVHCGRMDQEEIRSFVKQGQFEIIIDATHPFAKIITENIKASINGLEVLYLRLNRDLDFETEYDKIFYFDSSEACAQALDRIEGNILLTTGSKELPVFCAREDLRKRLFVRVLPGLESLSLCMDNHITGKQILALQGPFTAQMNEAMISQYEIQCLVTKQSGMIGGYQEKIKAAHKKGIAVFVIGQKDVTEGYSYEEVCRELEMILDQKIMCKSSMEILLAGVGMGSRDSMTQEVRRAIEKADILLGASRLIDDYHPRVEKQPFYTAEKIIPFLKKKQKEEMMLEGCHVVVLFSGDSGFYSGCQSLYTRLEQEIREGRLKASLRILPGISSVAYLSSCIGESYQDAAIYSLHGKEVPNLSECIRTNKKTFLLMSGVTDVQELGKLLLDAGLEFCTVWAGYQLSYPQQKIFSLTPEECCKQKEEGLYTCCIINPHAEPGRLTHGKPDTAFLRSQIPMTKEEIREISICKLRLTDHAVVLDIGSGTGSIAAEIAGLSENIMVYALEQKEEAVSLIRENCRRFHLNNVKVINTVAPKGIENLPVPTHAFIGGSGGKLKEILNELYRKNPGMRVVINAISMETLGQIMEIVSGYPIENDELVQIQVSRANIAGNHHLMKGENPVWIFSFDFTD